MKKRLASFWVEPEPHSDPMAWCVMRLYVDVEDSTPEVLKGGIETRHDAEVWMTLAKKEVGFGPLKEKDAASPEKEFHSPVKDNDYDYCEKCGEFCSEYYELCICCKRPALTEKNSG